MFGALGNQPSRLFCKGLERRSFSPPGSCSRVTALQRSGINSGYRSAAGRTPVSVGAQNLNDKIRKDLGSPEGRKPRAPFHGEDTSDTDVSQFKSTCLRELGSFERQRNSARREGALRMTKESAVCPSFEFSLRRP